MLEPEGVEEVGHDLQVRDLSFAADDGRRETEPAVLVDGVLAVVSGHGVQIAALPGVIDALANPKVLVVQFERSGHTAPASFGCPYTVLRWPALERGVEIPPTAGGGFFMSDESCYTYPASFTWRGDAPKA